MDRWILYEVRVLIIIIWQLTSETGENIYSNPRHSEHCPNGMDWNKCFRQIQGISCQSPIAWVALQNAEIKLKLARRHQDLIPRADRSDVFIRLTGRREALNPEDVENHHRWRTAPLRVKDIRQPRVRSGLEWLSLWHIHLQSDPHTRLPYVLVSTPC